MQRQLPSPQPAGQLSIWLHQVGLLALKVGHVAIRALHSTTAALDLYEQVISPVTNKQKGVQPPPPDTPQMLPSVHILWGALAGALRVRPSTSTPTHVPYLHQASAALYHAYNLLVGWLLTVSLCDIH